MSNRGYEYSHVSVELPTPKAEAVGLLLRGQRTARRLSIDPVTPLSEMDEPPELFTHIEDPREDKQVPIVQRHHIRAYAAVVGTKFVAERFISGLWRHGPEGYPSGSESVREQWFSMRRIVLRDVVNGTIGLRAPEIPDLYEMMAEKEIRLMGVGEKTIDFVGELGQAVQTQLRHKK
jgi:hypothetical protein